MFIMGYYGLLWVIPGYYGVLSHPMPSAPHCGFSGVSPDGNCAYAH